jgi:pSer/pThr/pTyr-binding forkhead associated (FHA) protein
MTGTIVLALRIILSLGLYALLIWAFITLWQDLRNQGSSLAARKPPRLTLTIQSGSEPSFIRHFAQAEITIGRDPNCDIQAPDETVSARHARLAFHHGQWWLEDLGSTNGTSLNQMRLSTPTVIIGGDQISCGQTNLKVNPSTGELASSTQRI